MWLLRCLNQVHRKSRIGHRPSFTGYSKEFMKASGKMDGKMQSRIMVVMKISKDPEKLWGTRKTIERRIQRHVEIQNRRLPVGLFANSRVWKYRICGIRFSRRSLWIAVFVSRLVYLRVSLFAPPLNGVSMFSRSGRSDLFL